MNKINHKSTKDLVCNQNKGRLNVDCCNFNFTFIFFIAYKLIGK